MMAFENSEYQDRLDKLRVLMTQAGLDALLVINESNLCYLTGYVGWSHYTPQAVLVTLDADPYLIVREVDLQNTPGTVWLPEDHQYGYDESSVGARAKRSPWTAIGEFVRGKVRASARIGLEFSFEGSWREVGIKDYPKLLEGLGREELSDGSGLVAKCKRVKSLNELAHMRDAAVISDQAILAGISKIAVGVRQADVAAAMMSKLISGTETLPGGALQRTPWMHVGSVGGFATAPHLKWTDEAYQAGQQTNLELGAYRHRYAAAVARTVYLGAPSARLREISKGVIEGWHAGFDALRPGDTCGSVARAVGAVLKPYGIDKATRCGYSIGIDWIDGGASLATNDDTELVPNMTFHLLIGIWNKDEGYNFSETVRVTESGAETLSKLPRELFEITV